MVSRALGFMRRQMFLGDGQHAASASGRIIDRADDAGLGQHLVILDEDQIDHEADDLARREMLAGRLVGDFREFADQLLEHEAHLAVVHDLGMKVDAGEFLRDLVEQSVLGEALDLRREIEPLENVAHRGREALHIGEQIFANMVLVAHELGAYQATRYCRSSARPCAEGRDRD